MKNERQGLNEESATTFYLQFAFHTNANDNVF